MTQLSTPATNRAERRVKAREQRDKRILSEYATGLSMVDVADKVGTSYRTVNRVLHASDVEVRPRGYQNPAILAEAAKARDEADARRAKRTKKHAEKRAEIRAKVVAQVLTEYQKGLSIRAVALKVDRSYSFVRSVLVDSDVELRPAGSQAGVKRGKYAPRFT